MRSGMRSRAIRRCTSGKLPFADFAKHRANTSPGPQYPNSSLFMYSRSMDARRRIAQERVPTYFLSAPTGEGISGVAGSDPRKVVAKPKAKAMMTPPTRNGVLPYWAFGRM